LVVAPLKKKKVVVYPLVASLVCNSFFIENSTYNAACYNQRDPDWPGGCTRQRHKLTMHQCNCTNWEMSYYRGDRSEASIEARHGAGAVQLQGGLLRVCLVSRRV
jgi:hypothetical protein